MEPGYNDQLTQRDIPACKELSAEELGLPSNICVVKKLGQGAMGAVFKVRHKVTNASLAVKVLLPQLAEDKTYVRRFVQEARASCALSSPHIVAVYDCGVTATNLPYILMEYVEGMTLRDLLAQNSPQLSEALDLFIQIAEALSHAHKRGIIHRDLKPSNIMLTTTDSGDVLVKVLDFGIARIAQQVSEATLNDLTATGEVLGTPWYMSPEQSMAEDVDCRSDIYSLGCVMYHVLTGKPPFTGATTLLLLMKHSREVVPDIGKARPDLNIPRGLQLIVSKTLEKRPEDRYASMDELMADLQRLRQKGSVAIWLTSSQRRSLRQATHLLMSIFIGFCSAMVLFLLFTFVRGLIGGGTLH